MTSHPTPNPSNALRRRWRRSTPLWAALALLGVLAGCDKSDFEGVFNPSTPTTTTTPIRKHQTRSPSSTVPTPDSSTPASSTPSTSPTPTSPAPTSPAPTSPGPTSPTPTVTTPPATTPPAPVNGRNCAVAPSSCGYPDATNTGPVAGTVLKRVPEDVSSGPGWRADSRGWITVDGAGAVIDGITTKLDIEVYANNVTVKNSVIEVGFDSWAVAVRHASGTVIKNNTLFATNGTNKRGLVGVKTIYGDESNTSVIANNIYNFSTGVQIYEGLIRDNYIHDMGFVPGDHLNGTTSNGGRDQLDILHNTILNSHDQTDAISLFEDSGVEANRRIENNLLAGGGYTIYGGANTGGPQTYNIKITGNRISRLYFPRGGYWGPLAAFDANGPGNVWSGNIWDDTGAPI